MVSVFPRGAESSCSQLTSDSCKVVRVGSSIADVEATVPSMVAHRHRDYQRHVHNDCQTRSGLPVSVEQRLRQSMIEAVSDEQQAPPLACERKIRREIANHNERKRMQSINAGFQSLRTLLPRNGGSSSSSADRLSKAAILQQAVDYISYLMHERQQLIELNRQCMSGNLGLAVSSIDVNGAGSNVRCSMSPMMKRCKYSDGEESLSDDSMKPSKAELAASHRALTSFTVAPMIRDRLKRRLPSQETTVDCSNPEQVAHSLQLDGGLMEEEIVVMKEEIAVVSSSDDPLLPHDPVSSSSVATSPGGCPSVSRRNLETIVEAIRHLEGESFYSDELSSLQSGADSESDRDDISAVAMSSLYSSALEPFAMLTAAAATTCNVQGSRLTLLRS